MIKDKGLMTIREAAAYLRVHDMTVYRWIREGRIPAFKIGTWLWRINRETLDNTFSIRGAENK